MEGPLTAAVLIVSTTAARDPSTDASASLLRDVIEGEGDGRWKVTSGRIVTDDELEIRKQVVDWADGPEPPNLIITTGGTGFAMADCTPEVAAA